MRRLAAFLIRSRIFRSLSVFGLLILLALPVVRTDEIEPLVGGLFVDELTVKDGIFDKGEALNLDEVTRLALMRSLDIQMVNLENAAERYEIPAAQAVYDSEFELWGDYTHDQEQKASVILGNRVLQGNVGASLARMFPTGTEVKVEARSRRDSTNTAFTSLSRFYSSYGSIEFKQPLLRNGFGYADRQKIKQVKLDVKKFDFESLDRIEGFLFDIRGQYWDLKLARESLEARRKALRKAQDFYKITYDKLDLGLTEKPDVFAAEANVRKRVLEVLAAENTLRSNSYGLKVLLNLPEIVLILPSETFDFKPLELDYGTELKTGLERRRDIRARELELERQQIEVKIRSQDRLPELNFEGRYTSSGLDRELASSQGEVFGFDHPQYYAEVRMTTSLENRDKRARHRQAGLDLKKAEKALNRTVLEAGRAIDQSYRDLLLAEERVRQTREIANLQRNKLLEEEKNFNRGRSSSKTIIDFQEDVIAAELDAIDASVKYEKAVDQFFRSTNQLLDKAGVTV